MVLLFGMAIVGCDDGSNDNRDSRLILPAGFAWVDDYPVGERDGYIFSADGTVQNIDDYSGYASGVWVIYATGTWSTSGNNTLTITMGGDTTVAYTVTSNTLTIDGEVLTRTAVTIP